MSLYRGMIHELIARKRARDAVEFAFRRGAARHAPEAVNSTDLMLAIYYALWDEFRPVPPPITCGPLPRAGSGITYRGRG
jgi:hypothetical protein